MQKSGVNLYLKLQQNLHHNNGLKWSINVILGLHENQKELGCSYILTSTLNSDVIEILPKTLKETNQKQFLN